MQIKICENALKLYVAIMVEEINGLFRIHKFWLKPIHLFFSKRAKARSFFLYVKI